MKTVIACLIALVLASVEAAVAQDRLTPDQTVARKIEAGKTDLFSMPLNDGDYVSVSLGYHGKINFFLLKPDSTIYRSGIGLSGDSKVPFAFAAEGAGSYSFKIVNPGDQPASYEVAIGKVVPLDERLKPEPWA